MNRRTLPLLFALFATVSLPAALPAPATAQEAPAAKPTDEQIVYRVTFGRADDVRILLSRGANPNAQNTLGQPLTHIALGRKDKESLPILQALVEGKADMEATGKTGQSPLIAAIRAQNAEATKFLIESGADYFAKDAKGGSVYGIAKQEGGPAVFKVVEDNRLAYEERLRAERSVEKLNQYVHDYTLQSCAFQYLVYYVESKQDESLDIDEMKTRLKAINKTVDALAGKLFSLFYITPLNLQQVRQTSGDLIVDDLDKLISNRNRREKGVGGKEDLTKRCEKIAALWKVTIEEKEDQRRVVIDIKDEEKAAVAARAKKVPAQPDKASKP